MQFKQTVVRLFFLLLPFTALSQSSYFPQGARENILIDRLEILAQNDSVLNFSKTRPFLRKRWIPVIEQYDNAGKLVRSSVEIPPIPDPETSRINSVAARLSKVDLFNADVTLMNSPEWSTRQFKSKKVFLKRFYQSPAHLYEVNVKDFVFYVNPVFQYYLGKEKNSDEHIFLNSRGASIRGRIADKIGFDAYVTDNQERDPLYVREQVKEHRAVPGAGFYKEFKTTGYDYFDARGSITFNAAKYIDIQFGYDKNFIGNGYRSLFLSDISAPYIFLKLNTRIWKFNYQNLFMELNSAQRLNADQLFPKKYAAMHHLDIGITRWLNVGLFEGVIFGRVNHFEFSYLNPVIFYRSIEQQNGSFDNSVAGLDAKANLFHHLQLYGQFLIDEFNLTELKKGSGWWGNKYGFQLGAKYFDAFAVPNLDLQFECNRMRPFTYSHRDSVANYTHYNQPLAHPLGANFQELIGVARYQPAPRMMVEAKAIYEMQGKDSGSISYGSNIFLPNVPPYRTMDFGYDIGSGVRTKTMWTSLLLSYEWKPNFFIEANAVYRMEAATSIAASNNTWILYAGIRWNMHRREFDY
ncbi:MAG: capsule assembly Wzi family protein [Flavisolibacter sp.]